MLFVSTVNNTVLLQWCRNRTKTCLIRTTPLQLRDILDTFPLSTVAWFTLADILFLFEKSCLLGSSTPSAGCLWYTVKNIVLEKCVCMIQIDHILGPLETHSCADCKNNIAVFKAMKLPVFMNGHIFQCLHCHRLTCVWGLGVSSSCAM